MTSEYDPKSVPGNAEDLFELAGQDGSETFEPRFITVEQAARYRAGDDEVKVAAKVDQIKKWILDGRIPYVEFPDGSIKLPFNSASIAMAELDGTAEFFTNPLPTETVFLEDAPWRPDWLD